MTQITLLDGSIGQELVKRSGDRNTPLWSTQVMIDHADLVGEVHTSYFAAGATIATANTYALHHSRLDRVGLSDQLPNLINTALTQANQARTAYPGTRIAGALGPLLATYRPDLNPDPDDAAAKYDELVQLMKSDVDLFLIETVSSIVEAIGALRGTQNSGKPVWLALSVGDDDGTHLRSGEPLADILPILKAYAPAAVLINCSPPETIPDALAILAQSNIPFGAYANGFTKISDGFLKDAPTVDALENRTDLDAETYATHVMKWVAQGATIVGGCCEIGPAHIAEIARQLRARGHTIT